MPSLICWMFVDRDGIYTSFYRIEPDYLIDISSLAECYKGLWWCHPANYFLSRLVPIDNARPCCWEI